MGEVLGLTPPMFLLVYAGLAVVSGAVAALWRWWQLGRGVTGDPDEGAVDPYEAALLAGGPNLAVSCAVRALCRLGVLGVDDGGRVVRRQPLPASAHAVERAVYGTVPQGVRPGGGAVGVDARVLPWQVRGAFAVDQLVAGLRGRGLLRDPVQIRRAKAAWVWLVPVLGLGLARLVAQTAAGRGVGMALVGLLTAAALAMALGDRARIVAPAGRRVLSRLRQHRGTAVELGLLTSSGAAGLTGTCLLSPDEPWAEGTAATLHQADETARGQGGPATGGYGL